MKRACVIMMAMISLMAGAEVFTGKGVYVPKDLQAMDLNDETSQWCWQRSVSTPDVVLMWAPGFGDNIAEAPELEGHDMRVDQANLLASVGRFYRYFYHDLGFAKPGTKADKYKMMVMLDYSLEGTAYGGDYDGEIGALWIAPNRVQDKRLNCIAHELGHSFQSQITCDGEGEAWGGHGIFEMCSQWMLWRVNPDWPTDENYHLMGFRDNTHKAFLHIDNIYHSPYVLEYWAEKHGDKEIADLFRAGRRDEDPVMTYKRLHGLSQEAFNDEMYDAVSRMANWDYNHARENMRKYATIWGTPMVKEGKWQRPDSAHVPEDYGFNIVPLDVPEAGKTVEVTFEGLTREEGNKIADAGNAGWRYGLVVVDTAGNASYTAMQSGRNGKIKYTVPQEGGIERIWLVVMGAPKEHRQLPRLYFGDDEDAAKEEPAPDRRWPWRIR